MSQLIKIENDYYVPYLGRNITYHMSDQLNSSNDISTYSFKETDFVKRYVNMENRLDAYKRENLFWEYITRSTYDDVSTLQIYDTETLLKYMDAYDKFNEVVNKAYKRINTKLINGDYRFQDNKIILDIDDRFKRINGILASSYSTDFFKPYIDHFQGDELLINLPIIDSDIIFNFIDDEEDKLMFRCNITNRKRRYDSLIQHELRFLYSMIIINEKYDEVRMRFDEILLVSI